MGTKATPILSEVDQRHLQGVLSTEETQDGQEERPEKGKAPGITEADDDQGEGTSTRILGLLDQETLKRVLHGDLDKKIHIDDELSMLCADYAYRCRQIDSLRCAQLHSDKYFTLARAAYT